KRPAWGAPAQERVGSSGEQTAAVRLGDRGRPVAYLQLGVDVLEMGLHARLADEQLPGRLPVGSAAGDQPQHLQFPVAQPWPGRPAYLAHELVGDRGGEHRLAAVGRAYRPQQFLDRRVLEQVSGRSEERRVGKEYR